MLRCQVTKSHHFIVNVENHHAQLGPSQQYAVRIDGQAWQRFPASGGRTSFTISPASHTIEVMTAGNSDLDAVWDGDQGFAIRSVEIDDAGQITMAAAKPVVDFIGDSITAGCWVNGKHAAVDYRPESNYTAIAADRLGVDSVRIAYSAGGVLRPATGGVPVASGFLPRIDLATPWQPNRPQLVVVNLGVNDRRFSSADFATAYEAFIVQVLTTFPAIPVVLLVPFSQSFRSLITTIGHRHRLPVINTAGWCPSFTDGLHPDQAGSCAAGKKLATALTPFLGKNGIK
ncbi:MAG: GDSL-type esterase/lipase family protein [Limosilactobacillus sp.]|nr:GDSL-type esterase/lipase family protein [Limosilactobacillus sp.]MCH3921504.1 GDSL-type esterase/lipase family protein [Limosilactobacillus sp.]MCH3928275.1 GDSL-type esterase/lipase family protein [Limosilactobacillus sp.]